jgi:hypothetical protein
MKSLLIDEMTRGDGSAAAGLGCRETAIRPASIVNLNYIEVVGIDRVGSRRGSDGGAANGKRPSVDASELDTRNLVAKKARTRSRPRKITLS